MDYGGLGWGLERLGGWARDKGGENYKWGRGGVGDIVSGMMSLMEDTYRPCLLIDFNVHLRGAYSKVSGDMTRVRQY